MVKKFINGIRFGIESFLFAWEEWQLSDPYVWQVISSGETSILKPTEVLRYCLEQEIIARHGNSQILESRFTTTFSDLVWRYPDCLSPAGDRYSLRVKYRGSLRA